ncbi:hypothetical protein D3C76_77340 [compost metagenome]
MQFLTVFFGLTANKSKIPALLQVFWAFVDFTRKLLQFCSYLLSNTTTAPGPLDQGLFKFRFIRRSTFHRAGNNAFDDVFLQEDKDDDRRQHGHNHGGHRVLPVGGVLSDEGVGGQR